MDDDIYYYFNEIYSYTINTGNTKYLQQYIKKYYNLLDKSSIELANNIIFQLTQEKLQNIKI